MLLFHPPCFYCTAKVFPTTHGQLRFSFAEPFRRNHRGPSVTRGVVDNAGEFMRPITEHVRVILSIDTQFGNLNSPSIENFQSSNIKRSGLIVAFDNNLIASLIRRYARTIWFFHKNLERVRRVENSHARIRSKSAG